MKFKKIIKKIIFNIIKILIKLTRKTIYINFKRVYILEGNISAQYWVKTKKKYDFYFKDLDSIKYLRVKRFPILSIFSQSPVLFYQDSENLINKYHRRFHNGLFNIDYMNCFSEPYNWHNLLNYIHSEKFDKKEIKNKFSLLVKQVRGLNKDKIYILGNGPSLEKAFEKDWSDGVVIVCNDIVKDEKIWNILKPDFLVAGDPVLFEYTELSIRFRCDLIERFKETETYFMFPSVFSNIVYRELCSVKERLIPIPYEGPPDILHYDLTENYILPCVGNVLGFMMLPLACTLSKNIYLWGFDGKAPKDKAWKHYKNVEYNLLPGSIYNEHPAYYKFMMPVEDPDKLFRLVVGKKLDRLLSNAEKDGWSFTMMHKSYSWPLNKRFKE